MAVSAPADVVESVVAVTVAVADAAASVVPVVVDRVTFLGFEVRVECHELSNGNPFTAEITRGDALALSLNPGDQIYARATRPAALQEWLGL